MCVFKSFKRTNVLNTFRIVCFDASVEVNTNTQFVSIHSSTLNILTSNETEEFVVVADRSAASVSNSHSLSLSWLSLSLHTICVRSHYTRISRGKSIARQITFPPSIQTEVTAHSKYSSHTSPFGSFSLSLSLSLSQPLLPAKREREREREREDQPHTPIARVSIPYSLYYLLAHTLTHNHTYIHTYRIRRRTYPKNGE